MCHKSVSYTHLDVYKRQMLADSDLRSASIQELGEPFDDCWGKMISEDLEAEAIVPDRVEGFLNI